MKQREKGEEEEEEEEKGWAIAVIVDRILRPSYE